MHRIQVQYSILQQMNLSMRLKESELPRRKRRERYLQYSRDFLLQDRDFFSLFSITKVERTRTLQSSPTRLIRFVIGGTGSYSEGMTTRENTKCFREISAK